LAVAVSIALRAARGALEEAALDARVPWPRWSRPNVCQWLKRSIGLATRGSVPLRGVGSRRLWGRPRSTASQCIAARSVARYVLGIPVEQKGNW